MMMIITIILIIICSVAMTAQAHLRPPLPLVPHNATQSEGTN